MKKQAHTFRDLEADKLEEVLSNYLVNSWSYSGITTFARNEKAFEKTYIYNEKWKKSASAIAGNAYHFALENYFNAKKSGQAVDLVDLETLVFSYIDQVGADEWKLQKTTPTIEDCKKKAEKIALGCLNNFLTEIEIFNQIDEVLEVEVYFDEFLTINGVDIPLPCHGKIDLIFRHKNGKIIVLDHKTATKYTDDKDVQYTHGKQGIIYTVGYETISENKVDEVWICENKSSKNRDKSPQLRIHKIKMDKDTRRLYEAQLYEPLRRMLEAVSNPDYIYLINENDNFVDRSELYEFWARTLIAEVDDFDIPENKKELIEKRLKKVRDTSISNISPKVIKNFQTNASAFITYDLSNKNMSNQEKIQHRLRSFGIPAQVAHKFEGYSSDTYLLEVQAGTPFDRVYRHRLDIANALGVNSVRMDENLFVYQGKSYFVVESSKQREKDLLFDKSYQVDSKIPVGVNNFSETIYWDLANPSTPHALVCGATGSGKSVWLKSTIAYAHLCGVEEIIIFDPKYDHAFHDVAGAEVINDATECEVRLDELVDEMNERIKNRVTKLTMIVFDEFADAVAQSRSTFGKNSRLESNLQLLLQKGRSCGFRIISATQRASTKIINGDAKVNFPVLICFKVPKAIDSKVVLDVEGAESLAGQGDGLINSPDYENIQRFQGFYI